MLTDDHRRDSCQNLKWVFNKTESNCSGQIQFTTTTAPAELSKCLSRLDSYLDYILV